MYDECESFVMSPEACLRCRPGLVPEARDGAYAERQT